MSSLAREWTVRPCFRSPTKVTWEGGKEEGRGRRKGRREEEAKEGEGREEERREKEGKESEEGEKEARVRRKEKNLDISNGLTSSPPHSLSVH